MLWSPIPAGKQLALLIWSASSAHLICSMVGIPYEAWEFPVSSAFTTQFAIRFLVQFSI